VREEQQEVECACQGQLSQHDKERQSPVRCGGTNESVLGATSSVATCAGKVRLMNRGSTEIVRVSFSFVVAYSGLPKSISEYSSGMPNIKSF
jgi:hypothetical protein